VGASIHKLPTSFYLYISWLPEDLFPPETKNLPKGDSFSCCLSRPHVHLGWIGTLQEMQVAGHLYVPLFMIILYNLSN